MALPIGTVTADSEGKFSHDWSIPIDVGGPHRIEASVDGEKVAEPWVSVLVSVRPLDVSSGPWGTDFEISLSGVGWTETANIYAIVYDNGYLGYACGFNTQGEVTIPLTMTGEPGWHFVDLYPAIYKGEEARGRNKLPYSAADRRRRSSWRGPSRSIGVRSSSRGEQVIAPDGVPGRRFDSGTRLINPSPVH